MNLCFLFQPGGNIVGVAVDSHAGLLFWSNNVPRYKGIWRADVNGQNVQRILHQCKYTYYAVVEQATQCHVPGNLLPVLSKLLFFNVVFAKRLCWSLCNGG